MKPGKSFSGIQLGSTAILGGQTYKVIGRVAYEGHDDEESWVWEEWRLTDGQNDYWLEYEPEYPRFTLYRETTEIPQPISGTIIDPNETGTLTSFDGEIPWPARVGEQYTYTTYRIAPGQLYSEEIDQGEKEFFLGTILSTSDVKKAFSLKELNSRGPGAGGLSNIGSINAGFWILALLFIVVLPVLESLEGFETPIFGATLPACAEPAPGCAAIGTRLGLIKLEHANHPYVVEVASGLKNASKPDVTFLLREANSEEVRTVAARTVAATPTAPDTAPLVSITGDSGRALFRVTKPEMYVLEITSIRTQPNTALTVTVSEDAYVAYVLWLPSGIYSQVKRLLNPNAY